MNILDYINQQNVEDVEVNHKFLFVKASMSICKVPENAHYIAW